MKNGSTKLFPITRLQYRSLRQNLISYVVGGRADVRIGDHLVLQVLDSETGNYDGDEYFTKVTDITQLPQEAGDRPIYIYALGPRLELRDHHSND